MDKQLPTIPNKSKMRTAFLLPKAIIFPPIIAPIETPKTLEVASIVLKSEKLDPN